LFWKTIIIDLFKHLKMVFKGDFIKEEHYNVIICFNYLQRSLIPVLKKGLRPGGVMVYETYILD